MKLQNQNIASYEILANHIIESINSGDLPKFMQQWESNFMLPMNLSTGKTYQGKNLIHLLLTINKDSRYLTFLQAKELGYKVRKGAKATKICAYKPDYEKEIVRNQLFLTEQKGYIKYYNVFSCDDIEGVPAIAIENPNEWERIEKIESKIEKMINKIKVPIEYGKEIACYIPDLHMIQMPNRDRFKNADDFYYVLLHELGHATKKELPRATNLNEEKLNYAREELRAEISSYLIAQQIGLANTQERNFSYVQEWAKFLKNDPKEITILCKDAEEISKFLLTA